MAGDIGRLVDARSAGTRKWLLDKINDWACEPYDSANTKQVFWLLAHAGAGKSVVAACATTVFEKEKILAASFFCKHDDQDRRSPASLVVSIAYQLSKLRGFEAFASKLLELKREKVRCPFAYATASMV